MEIKHTFVSTQPQGADPTKVSKNEWNADHNFFLVPSDVGAEPANANIQTHVTGTGSPHTAVGVGAEAAGAVATHAALLASTHGVSASGFEDKANKEAVSGYAGLNVSSRITKGVDTTDDLIIDLATKGVVFKDTQAPAHYWRLDVSVLGVLSTTDLGVGKP